MKFSENSIKTFPLFETSLILMLILLDGSFTVGSSSRMKISLTVSFISSAI